MRHALLQVLTTHGIKRDTLRPSPGTQNGYGRHHLADLAEASNITATIGIVPFAAQLPVMTLHGWVVRDQAVTIAHADGDATIAAPADVACFVTWTHQLLDIALTGPAAAHLIRLIATQNR